MDLLKTGKFIQELRKNKNLTQVQLAEKINVSEKTISKWECGNGFPDTSLILPLCEALNITANELLAGKRIETNEEYRLKAEENLLELKNEQEKSAKHLLTLEWVLGYISIIVLLSMVFVASFCPLANGWRIGLILFGVLNCFVGVHFCLKIEQLAGFYECAKCKHKYVPKYSHPEYSWVCW